MAERLPAGTAAVYHPTTAERVPALLRAVEGGVPQGVRVPVSPTPAGQAPVVVQFAPTHVSGRPAPAAFGPVGPDRYVVDKTVPGAVVAVEARTPSALRGLRANPRVARLFDFDRAEPTAGGVWVPRRGVAEAGEPVEVINTAKRAEDWYRKQTLEYLEELFGREAAADFKAGGSLPPFRSRGDSGAYQGVERSPAHATPVARGREWEPPYDNGDPEYAGELPEFQRSSGKWRTKLQKQMNYLDRTQVGDILKIGNLVQAEISRRLRQAHIEPTAVDGYAMDMRAHITLEVLRAIRKMGPNPSVRGSRPHSPRDQIVTSLPLPKWRRNTCRATGWTCR